MVITFMEEGKWVSFCDAYNHRSWNRTKQQRFVLIVDVLHSITKHAQRHCNNVHPFLSSTLPTKYPIWRKCRTPALIRRINKLRAWVYLTIYISSYTKNREDNFVWRNSSTIQGFKCWAFTMFFTEIIYGLSPEKRNSIKFWRARPFGIHSGFTKGSVEYFTIYETLTGDFRIIILRGTDTHFIMNFIRQIYD